MNKQRMAPNAAIDRGVIRGTTTAPTGECRQFHGWLELNAALESILSGPASQPEDPAKPETEPR